MHNHLINRVKEKKELSGIDESIIEKVISKLVNGINIDLLKEKELKEIVKQARSELRILSGGFRDYNNLSENPTLMHSSTRERKDFYPKLRKIISELNIKSILDLGSGVNPLELADKSITYYASDINQSDLSIIDKFFKENNIRGKTFIFDLRDIDQNYNELPKADLCLLFKVLDVIEKKGHKLAEKIIKLVDAKYFLISFSTKTLSGKPMNHPQRGWIERLLSRLGYSYTLIKEKNEIFYLFEKL